MASIRATVTVIVYSILDLVLTMVLAIPQQTSTKLRSGSINKAVVTNNLINF